MGDSNGALPHNGSASIIGGKTTGAGSGTFLKNEGEHVNIINHDIENMGIGIDAGGGGFTYAQDVSITNSQNAAARISDSSFLFDNIVVRGGNLGLDLGRGARGAIQNSEVVDNWEADIRYTHDVSVRVFDTAARDLLNRTNGSGIEAVDTRWMSNRLLATTSSVGKAQWIMKMSKRGILGLIGGELASEALRRALDML